MKTEANETDRQAAELFEPDSGMRVQGRYAVTGQTWFRVLRRAHALHILVATDDGPVTLIGPGNVVAIDTDDLASVGCMLAQVEESLAALGAPGAYMHPWDGRWAVRRGAAVRRYAGDTKGAALVAAMAAAKK